MIIRLSDNKIIETIDVGIAPFGLALNTKRNELYSANVRSNNVSVINLDTKNIKNIQVGIYPYSIEEDNKYIRIFLSNL
jgi:40-residue YVTN family beta-propeller repeat